jgi:hypothetical protein
MNLRFRRGLGIRQQECGPAASRDSDRTRSVIVAPLERRGRVQHAEIDAVPAPGLAAAAEGVARQATPFGCHRDADGQRLSHGFDSAGVVRVVVAQDQDIDCANAASAEVWQQGHLSRRTAGQPARAGVEDERVTPRFHDRREPLADVHRGQREPARGWFHRRAEEQRAGHARRRAT